MRTRPAWPGLRGFPARETLLYSPADLSAALSWDALIENSRGQSPGGGPEIRERRFMTRDRMEEGTGRRQRSETVHQNWVNFRILGLPTRSWPRGCCPFCG